MDDGKSRGPKLSRDDPRLQEAIEASDAKRKNVLVDIGPRYATPPEEPEELKEKETCAGCGEVDAKLWMTERDGKYFHNFRRPTGYLDRLEVRSCTERYDHEQAVTSYRAKLTCPQGHVGTSEPRVEHHSPNTISYGGTNHSFKVLKCYCCSECGILFEPKDMAQSPDKD